MSKGTEVTVVKYGEENLRTRLSWMHPDTTSWLNVTVPPATALTAKWNTGSVFTNSHKEVYNLVSAERVEGQKV